ncbi:MAG TPA: hypothetical protein ENK09_04310, partial [Nitrospirae bacterium]|nr:hypothetical protein [Nitrospirota bacterium]
MTRENKDGEGLNYGIRFLPLQIFIVSFITLSYETSLLRIFSLTLWYHFAFMIISIAMLGIGASGALLYLFPALLDIKKTDLYYVLLCFSIFSSYLLSNQIPFDPARVAWEGVQVLYIMGYCVILSAPFFFSGLIIATVLKSAQKRVGFFYGMDLLGAGMGAFSVIALLFLMPPEKALVLLSMVSLVVAPLFRIRMVFLSVPAVLVILSVLLFYPSWLKPRISPYKPLALALKYPGARHIRSFYSPFSRVDLFKSPAARYAPGLSLQYLGTLPEQIGVTIDGDNMTAITVDSDREKLSFLGYLPSSLAFELSEKSDVLLVEPKGGLDVLSARYHGFRNIYRADSDPTIIMALNRIGSDIYRENSWKGLARSWLQRKHLYLDLINISLLSGGPTGVFGFAEDYRYTIDAFVEYLTHLKPQGYLSVNLYILPPPRTEFRVVNTIYEALKTMGIRNIEEHIAAIRSWGVLSIIVKKSPLTERDMRFIKRFCKERGFDLLYYRGIKEEETNIFVRMSDNTYFHAFRSLMNPGKREAFINSYLFDITARDDNSPFFHYYLKTKNLKEIYRTMGRKWQFFIEEGYLLPLFLLVLLLLSLLIVLIPLLKGGSDPFRKGRRIPFFVYFSSLGMGYMFVEIALIQKLIYPLEHPALSFATVVSAVVISSAAGSILSQRWQSLR